MSGYVYAFQSPSMHGVVKIGATKRDPSHRLAEANGTWGPPRPYVMTGVAFVDDAFATERTIHTLLAKRRESPRREFFRLSDDETRALFAILALSDPAPAAADRVDLAPSREHARALDALRRTDGQPSRAELDSEGKLRKWVEEHYVHVPLREKDSGTKLEALYTAYTSAQPPVHTKLLGKILFGKMLGAVYLGIGPHRNGAGTVSGLYLLRRPTRADAPPASGVTSAPQLPGACVHIRQYG
jgi:hypothetical protein